VKFLIDNQLPAALARALEANGMEAKHVLDLGLDEANDRAIWAYAKSHGFTVVSKDEDFLHLATLDSDGPTLIWVRLGNCRKVALLAAFEGILPTLLEAVRSGQRIIEVQ
jgi:predicted nuclease of predicted toxin-antitoxin system